MLEKYSEWAVLRVFFDTPNERLGLREIGRRAEISHTSVKSHLEKLMEAGLIIEKKEKKNTRTYPVYTTNAESSEFRHYRRLDILERVKTSGLLHFLEEKLTPDCIVLFGSASRGEDQEDSDIDLFVQAEEKDLDLSKYEEDLSRKIQLHLKEDIREYPEELRNNIANGVVLHGYLEVE